MIVSVSGSGFLVNGGYNNNISQFQLNKAINSILSKYCFKHNSERNRKMMSIEINRCVKILMILNKLK